MEEVSTSRIDIAKPFQPLCTRTTAGRDRLSFTLDIESSTVSFSGGGQKPEGRADLFDNEVTRSVHVRRAALSCATHRICGSSKIVSAG
jgi:hypothetical protein